MFSGIKNFFLTGQDKPTATNDTMLLQKMFRSKKWGVFSSLVLGYALFYVLRLNFSVIKKPLLTGGVLDANQLGIMGSLFFITYGLGKFVNSLLADRLNVKRFLAAGLFLSALASTLMGLVSSFYPLVILWALNGWFQSFGAGSCIVSLNQWFSQRERGTFYGIWFASHNIGAGFTYLLTATIVTTYSWQMGFLFPGFFCIVGSLILYRFLADRPPVYGLPTAAVMNNDFVGEGSQTEELSKLQLSVIKNPAVWILGLSSCFCYVTRYAIESWGIVFLTLEKSYTTVGAAGLLTVMQIAGIVGTITCGLISDRLFNHKRNVPCLIFGILYAGSTAVFIFVHGSEIVDTLAMVVYGYTMGALVCYLGGLMAVDISPKRATGAAMGMIGLLSYGGASLQELVSGHLLKANSTVINGVTHYNFVAAGYFWVGAAVLSLVLALLVWNVHVKDDDAVKESA